MRTGDGKGRQEGGRKEAPDSPSFTAGPGDSRRANLSGCRVSVVDANEQRALRVDAVVEEAGATSVAVSAVLPPHAVLVAVPREQDEEALEEIRRRHAAGQVVLAYGDGADTWPLGRKCRPLIAGARRLLDSGAASFDALVGATLREALGALMARLAEERALRERLSALGVEGRGAAMLDVFRHVLRFASLGDLPVLVTGETGTGKERIARALHASDPRRARGPFVAVNCGALVSTLAESELFGHRRGAFTGAERARPGLVRAADGGVLFLDEIGELEPALQTKLLRVVQEGRVLGVGEEEEVAVDVRIIAATHRDLPTLVAAGRFRADLLHRLAVLPLHLPPLRERPEDLPVLVEHLLARYRRLHPAALQPVSSEFVAALGRLRLEGNVRQLENILRQALVHKRGEGPLALADLPPTVLAELAAAEGERESAGAGTSVRAANAAVLAAPTSGSAAGSVQSTQSLGERPERFASARVVSTAVEDSLASATSLTAAPVAADPVSPKDKSCALTALLVELAERHAWNLSSCLRACEREVFAAALARMSGNQTRAARLLGLSPRCVYNKLRKLGFRGE